VCPAQDVLEGMQQGIAIKQAWMVANGAAMAWNAYLPVMQQQRHGELGGVLLPLLHTLLKVSCGGCPSCGLRVLLLVC
jgi:hypothetical protein